LLRRAIGKYQQSLTLFADAYCVQARLAVQMAAIGLNDEAEEHYRRAFELMPDSFGRVESHCFGCEHAFGGEKAQGIAEKIFTGLLQKSPDKAQLHYLMGYLRKQQDRDGEAVVHLKNAVKLDPDYLNAWKLLAQISETVQASPQESDDDALNLIRLDPAGRHGGGYSEVADLSRLWAAVKAVSQKIPEQPPKLFRLPASADQLEKARPGRMSDFSGNYSEYTSYSPKAASNPALAVARDPVISGAAMSLGAYGRGIID
jgi:tetratricopeptide (TPR) repeat protein